jgi:hypothetical protein
MGDIEKKDFIKMYHEATRDYSFLLINCNSVKNTSDLNSMYGKIKTPSEYI